MSCVPTYTNLPGCSGLSPETQSKKITMAEKSTFLMRFCPISWPFIFTLNIPLHWSKALGVFNENSIDLNHWLLLIYIPTPVVAPKRGKQEWGQDCSVDVATVNSRERILFFFNLDTLPLTKYLLTCIGASRNNCCARGYPSGTCNKKEGWASQTLSHPKKSVKLASAPISLRQQKTI